MYSHVTFCCGGVRGLEGASPIFSNFETLSKIPLLIRLPDDLLVLVVSLSEIQPGAPVGLSWKFKKVGVDMALEGKSSHSWDGGMLPGSEEFSWPFFIL